LVIVASGCVLVWCGGFGEEWGGREVLAGSFGRFCRFLRLVAWGVEVCLAGLSIAASGVSAMLFDSVVLLDGSGVGSAMVLSPGGCWSLVEGFIWPFIVRFFPVIFFMR
jgi:hypothetical protein